MNKKADLHVHTIYSDGILSPAEVMKMAVDHNIAAISITDHDTIDGCLEAHKLTDRYPVEIINGIEFSSYENTQEYHILGYNVDPDFKPLKKHLSDFRIARLERAEKICKKLNRLGLVFSFSEVLQRAGDAPITRPHIAATLVDLGFFENIKDAFNEYIGDGRPAFEDKKHFPVEKCIKLINDSGGLSSLAHPAKTITQSILYRFIKYGLDGIEVVHPSHKERMQKYYHSIASQYWLLGTGGSDYHGIKEWDSNNFGNFVVPYTVVESIKNYSPKV